MPKRWSFARKPPAHDGKKARYAAGMLLLNARVLPDADTLSRSYGLKPETARQMIEAERRRRQFEERRNES